MGAKKTQVLLLVSALILFVLLFIAPKLAPKKAFEELTTSSDKGLIATNANLDVYLSLALKNMASPEKQAFDKFLTTKNYDSLASIWNKLKRPDLAAYYMEELAKHSPSPQRWMDAGNRYYYSVQFTQDKSEHPALYQCAMRCFMNGLKLDSKNSEAKIMLASCYIEGTQSPMEGVSMLKEIEKVDSNNVKLQLTFAFFSVKSGQLDKAIARFNKVLKIDSSYVEAYLHLADAYEQQGNDLKTIEMLEKYSKSTSDITARMEIDKYIQQLKQKQ